MINDPSRITIVTVTHNSDAVIGDMLSSVPKGVPIVLIDNASVDPSLLRTLAEKPIIKLQENEVNQGFGRACNQGAALAQTEFVLFLNPDAALHEGALDALLIGAETHPKASAFNPRLLDRKGNQTFRRRSKLRPKHRFAGPVPIQDVEIPSLLGSAIFVRKALFDAVGGFDPAIFLYHEDDDLALRLQEHGPLMYCHAAIVTHLEGRSSVRTPNSAAFKAFYMARSRVYAYSKHGYKHANWTTLRIAGLRLLSPEMLVSRRKRAKNIGFFKGAWSALKDGGRYSA